MDTEFVNWCLIIGAAVFMLVLFYLNWLTDKAKRSTDRPNLVITIGGHILTGEVSENDRPAVRYLMAKPQVFNSKDQAWYDLTVSKEHEFVRWPNVLEKAEQFAKEHAESYSVPTRVITFVPYVTAEFP
jgi:hypothetical protein